MKETCQKETPNGTDNHLSRHLPASVGVQTLPAGIYLGRITQEQGWWLSRMGL